MTATTYDSTEVSDDGVIRSLVPARIDRINWSRFHTRLVVALGVAWILDGLEITIASNVTNIISQPDSLHLSSGAVGLAVGTIYLLGEVFGAILFGGLSDRFGRKNLFMITLGVYLLGGALSALTLGTGTFWAIWLGATRFVSGAGIGGEYAAINSAIDELIPAKYRGRVDVGVNGTYWAGAFIAATLTYFVVNNISDKYNWRLAFLVGPVLGFIVLFVRKNLPESPRWLLMHGRVEEAEAAVKEIERHTLETGGSLDDVDPEKRLEITPAANIGFFALARTLFTTYPKRSIYGASLMIAQSFLYNAIFFTYALVLTNVFHVAKGRTELYFMVFAAGNLLGPLLLGHLFDTVGRRRMISGTYLLSGALLLGTAIAFKAGALTAVTQTICWGVVFFFASAGASAAYLTVSEIFPVEVRAKAIAVFFAIAQSFGAFGPWFYGKLIGSADNPDHTKLFYGYLIGSLVMMIGGVIAAAIGVDSEGKSLEDVSTPLSALDRGAARVSGRLSPRGGLSS